MFFHREHRAPERAGAPPEKTGPGRLFEILQAECGSLVKVNLLFLLSSLPLVTIPPALWAMNQVVRAMVQDQPVRAFADYRRAFCQRPGRSYAAFLLLAAPLVLGGYGAGFYLRYAGERPVLLLPFLFCSTVFLATLLASTYLYGILAAGATLPEALRLALKLGVGRPLRALLAVLFGYGLTVLLLTSLVHAFRQGVSLGRALL